MKNIVLISLIIIIGCVLATGCVGQLKQETNETLNNKTATPTNTFAPFSNTTNMSNSTNSTNITIETSGLKGPLTVSIGGWDASLPVLVDDQDVGTVTKVKPLNLMLDEGNHTVKVCAGTKCIEEVVTIKFAKQRTVDFEDRLIKELEFPNPTARINGYYTAGDQVSVTVEFINPSSKDLSMTAEVKCAYTYIESRSNNRVGGSAQSLVNAYVESGKRTTQTVNLYLVDGWSYTYSIPVISESTSR